MTLSVDDETLRESKAYLAEKGMTVGDVLQNALSEMAVSSVVEKVASSLGVKLGYVGYDEVPRRRPRKDAAKTSKSEMGYSRRSL